MPTTPEELRFDFAAPVLPPGGGTMGMAYVPLSLGPATALLAAGTRRVRGLLQSEPFSRALHGATPQTLHLRFGKTVLRGIGKAQGDWVEVELWPDPDPDRVDVPPELAAALAADDEARERFEGMTPGKRRSLCHHVATAKRPETRTSRAADLARKLRTYTLHSDKR